MTDEVRDDGNASHPAPLHHTHFHRGAVIGLAVAGALVFGAISFGTGWHARGFAFRMFGGPGSGIAWQQDGYGPSGYRGGPGAGCDPGGFRDGGGPGGDYRRGGFESGPGMRGGMRGGVGPGMRGGGPRWRDDGSVIGTDTPGADTRGAN